LGYRHVSNGQGDIDEEAVLVAEGEEMTSIGQPIPELPVADVERAQRHYRDALGFQIGWLYPGSEIAFATTPR
jgi:hypothetical protein